MKKENILEISSLCIKASPNDSNINNDDVLNFKKEGIKLIFNKSGDCIGGYHVYWSEEVTYQRIVFSDYSSENGCRNPFPCDIPIYEYSNFEYDKEKMYLVLDILKMASENSLLEREILENAVVMDSFQIIKRKGKTFVRNVYTFGGHLVATRYFRKIGPFICENVKEISKIRSLANILNKKYYELVI